MASTGNTIARAAARHPNKTSYIDRLAFLLFFTQIFFAGALPYGLPAFFLRWSTFFFCVSQVIIFRPALRTFFQTITPFTPFLAIGLFSGFTGYDPAASLTTGLPLMLQMAFAATIVARLGADRSVNAILTFSFLAILAGIVVAIAIPDFGTMMRGGDANWRGFSQNKNQFGWLAAVTGVAFIVLPSRLGWPARITGMLVCVVATYNSDSKTSIVALAISTGFYFFLRTELKLRFSPATAAIVNGLASLVFIVAGAAAALIIIPALGRDLTFTGRTVVWSAYLSDMADTPFFGKGPTAYSSPNGITEALSVNNDFAGQIIETPHNFYIATLGETGLFGLLAILACFYFLLFVRPFREPRFAPITAVFVMMHCIGGFQETHTLFGTSLSWFLIFWSSALSIRARQGQRAHTANPFSGRPVVPAGFTDQTKTS